jgi:hypothetical protein
MKRSDHATLEQTPKALDVVRMHGSRVHTRPCYG